MGLMLAMYSIDMLTSTSESSRSEKIACLDPVLESLYEHCGKLFTGKYPLTLLKEQQQLTNQKI